MTSIRSVRFGYAFLTTNVLGCLLGAAAPAHAEDFSWQLSGATSHQEVADQFDSDTSSIDATYYFDPIDDTDGPYALASFFNPTTRVSAAVSRHDSSINDSGIGAALGDGPTAYTLSGRYVWPSTRWYAGASYSKSDVDNEPSPFRRQTDPKSYSVLAGKYLGGNTTLELEMGSSKLRNERESPCLFPTPFCVRIPITIEIETDVVSLDVVHVRRFRSLTYSLQGGISQTDTDVDIRVSPVLFPLTTPPPGGVNFVGVVPPVVAVASPVGFNDRLRVYSVAGELFPIPQLGVRLGYSRPDGANVPDSDVYDLATTWFFKPHIAVQVSFARATQDDFDIDTDIVALRFIGRL